MLLAFNDYLLFITLTRCYERWALTVNMWGKRYSVLESAAEKLFLRQTKPNYEREK